MRALDTKNIVLATHNAGKLAEMRQLCEPFGLRLTSAADHDLPEPPEDGTTFEQNAYTKAYAAATATGMVALSDDSGLCVDALDGDPGVYTADWAERPDGLRDFSKAMEKVERALNEVGLDPSDTSARKASFNATMCLCWPDGHAEYFKGVASGTLVWPPRGESGHGYDPVFQPDGHERTFGEMTAEEKHGWKPGDTNALSHRARAVKAFAEAMLGEPK